MTPDEFAAEMAGIGEALPRTINELLIDAAQQIEGQIKAGAPYRTGDLRQSIRVNVNGTELGIEMLDYGWFQNYGVRNKDNQGLAFAVPKEDDDGNKYLENLQPKSGDYYKFGVRETGLPGQWFLNIEETIEKIAEIINKRLEL